MTSLAEYCCWCTSNNHKVVIEKPEITEGKILISHIGDGEYEYNVFGSAWTSWEKFVEALKKAINPKDTFFSHKLVSLRTYSETFIIFYDSRIVAELTIEKLNPEDNVLFS